MSDSRQAGSVGDSLSDSAFRAFQQFTLEHTGIQLSENKKAMIVTRFGRRLQALSLSSFEDYLELISDPFHPETIEFIDTITTNLTYFFREPHHFELLSNTVLPLLVGTKNSSLPIRIWSAGCSSGQEPYSLAIAALECAETESRSVRILCTDIHTKLVQQTFAGVYTDNELRGLSQQQKDTWFKQCGSGMWQAKSRLRELLICKQLNLFGPWPVKPDIDIIMCRNVLIYFDELRQKKVLTGFADMQSPGAYLFLGHSETLNGFNQLYKRVDNTVYQRR